MRATRQIRHLRIGSRFRLAITVKLTVILSTNYCDRNININSEMTTNPIGFVVKTGTQSFYTYNSINLLLTSRLTREIFKFGPPTIFPPVIFSNYMIEKSNTEINDKVYKAQKLPLAIKETNL